MEDLSLESTQVRQDSLLKDDLNAIVDDKLIPWNQFSGKRVLVTGATGLLGSLLVKSLLCASDKYDFSISILAFVHDTSKVSQTFMSYLEKYKNKVHFHKGDICSPLSIDDTVDYIIHAAAPTSSTYFVEKPVETIAAVYQGTANVLALARKKDVKSMLYISSMEVYGQLDHVEAKEEDAGSLDPLAVRSSYPQAKRLAETLCAAYAREYGFPVKIARPTLVFGPGVSPNDNRVFMQMARAALAHGEIRLATDGATERDYIYTADACRMLFSILLKGENGQAYNVANPETYMSILDLAKAFQKARPLTTVQINTGNDVRSYANEMHITLCIEAIKK
ncbi:MAG: NAD-dependent epimerase/dehydratase family protein, partial [Desulfovibrio sp.]|nr:NAD-dependent epimerase/dehydratase family protein [Desulfovibrio sp.]